MKKQNLGLFLIICIIFVCFAAMPISASAASNGTCGANLTWELSDNGTLTISGIGDMDDYVNFNIPWSEHRDRIKKLILPDGLTHIGENAFRWCNTITGNLTIPDSVVSIGDFAFYGCGIDGDLIIPSSVKTIGRCAFAHHDSENMYINVDTVYFEGNPPDVESEAFANSIDILVPKGNENWTVPHWNGYHINWYISGERLPQNIIATAYCGDNVRWFLDDEGTLTLSGTGAMWDVEETLGCCSKFYPGVYAWEKYNKEIKKLVIEEGVTHIGNYAFFSNDITFDGNLLLPDSVKTIGEGAFVGCKFGGILDLGNVVSIGKEAFANYNEINNCFAGDLIISDSVMEIGESAFEFCQFDGILDLGNVATIGDKAFSSCSGLSGSLIIPNSVKHIGSDAFETNCFNKDVTVPASVTYIGESAFSWWNEVYFLGNALNNCPWDYGAYCIYVPYKNKTWTVPEWNENEAYWYSPSKNNTPYVVKCGRCQAEDDYNSNVAWTLDSDGLLTIEGYGKIGSVLGYDSMTGHDCRSEIKSAIIDGDVTNIAAIAFSGCINLTDVAIYDGVTIIESYAFRKCKNLKSVTMGDSVRNIGAYAFYDCENLTDITISDNVTVIEQGTFYGCKKLRNITIPAGVTKIEKGAFVNCDGLTSIIIPNSVTSVEEDVFSGCGKLTNVYYTGSKTEWDNVIIYTGNDCLKKATKYYNSSSSGKTDSLNNSSTSKLNLTIYENKNDSSKVNDSYRLSSDAEVKNESTVKASDYYGSAVLNNDGSNITVSKEGYVTRTITANRVKKARRINLQKDTGVNPILQAVWIGNTDIYSQKYEVDILSKKQITLEAEVVWKTGTQSKIYLMQDSRRVDFIGTTLTTVLSDNFDVTKPIYIVAEDTNGNTTKKELKIEGTSVLDDYELDFGDSVKATLPDSVPVIGGTSVGIDMPFIPLTVTFEDNKFYAVLGLDVVKATEDYGFIENVNKNSQETYDKATKYLFENIKDSFKESTEAFNMKKLKSKWKKAKYNYSAKLGFESDLTIIGYMEGYVDSNGKVSVLDGGIGINPSVSVSAGSQFWSVPPLYWEAEVKGEIEAMMSLYLNEVAKNFKPNGSLGGKVTLEGGVGLGACGVIGVSGGLSGSIGVNWDIYQNREDYIALKGSIGAYVKAFAGPITLLDMDFPFAEGIIWDNPSTKAKSLSIYEKLNLYNTSSYALIDRSYAENESEFVANESGSMLFSIAPQNKIEKNIKTNVYTYSEPQLVEFSDGTMLSVWLDDDTTREAINRTALYYSYYDGTQWCEPAQINDDRTGDYYPDLKVINDVAYIVWVDANMELNNNADITEMFNIWEISTAKFDKNNNIFTNVATVTNDSDIDMLPKIFGEGKNVKLAWVKSTSNDIFCSESTYSIHTSILTSGNWDSEGVYASNLMPIDSIDGCIYNGSTYIAYAIDTDGNQEDYTDKEVYLNNVCLTNNQSLDSKPVFSKGKLYYYSDGKIVEHNIVDNSVNTIVDAIPTDRFSIITDENNSAIIYGKSDELVSELYAIMYDAGSNSWGEGIALTELSSNISSYSGVFSQDGNMKFAINKTDIVGDINSANPYGQTDIALFTVTPTHNLAIGDVVYHEELLMEGNTVEFYTSITNKGEMSVNNFAVLVIDESGNVLSTTYGKEPILPGQTVEFTAYYPLGGEAFAPHNVTISVLPLGADDFDTSDNDVELYLNYENISLENINYGINEEGKAIIYADVVNRGYGSGNGITATLYKGGEAVDTAEIIEDLNTLDLAVVSFEVPFEENAVYYVQLNKAGQNNDFVVLEGTEDQDIFFDKITNTIKIDSSVELSNASLIVASYQDGRLVKLQIKTVDVKIGENTYNSPLTDFTGANNAKVMIWNNLNNINPLFNAYIFKLN